MKVNMAIYFRICSLLQRTGEVAGAGPYDRLAYLMIEMLFAAGMIAFLGDSAGRECGASVRFEKCSNYRRREAAGCSKLARVVHCSKTWKSSRADISERLKMR